MTHKGGRIVCRTDISTYYIQRGNSSISKEGNSSIVLLKCRITRTSLNEKNKTCGFPSDSPHHHSLAAPFMPSLCLSLFSDIVLLSACQRLSALSYRVLCVSGSLLCLSVVLYSSTNDVFFLWSLQHSDLGWSVCLPTTLCCLLVCHCMFRAGRVDVDGGLEQVRRGCMVSAGRFVFWCPLVGAESDSCGRNGRWRGIIFRHNGVHV